MTWKGIILFFSFFLITPLLLGQDFGNAPEGISTPTSTPRSTALPISDLQGAGLDTESMDQSWGERARENQDNNDQGLPQEVPSSQIPTVDSEGLASSFAQELFPQEYTASQGEFSNIPESSSVPTSTPAF